MRPLFRLILLLVLGAGCTFILPSVQAQDRIVEPRPGASARAVGIAASDSTLDRPTLATQRGRVEPASGVMRARYRIEDSPQLSSPEAVREFLAVDAGAFGISASDDLELVRDVRTGSSRHVTFRQVRAGIPVYGAEVKVNLNADGRPSMILSNYQPHVAEAELPPQRLSPEAATQVAADRSGRTIRIIGDPEVVIYPSQPARLAWRIVAVPADDSGEWLILIDASDGDVILWMDQSTHARAAMKSEPRESANSLNTSSLTSTVEAVATVDGEGAVFDPDPLTTAGVEYGPPYVNADDADVPELNAERKSVVLREISQGVDGQYRLDGPYARIIGGDVIGAPYEPPVASSPDGFHFSRANDFFEAVNAYYHVDTSQRYVQTLDPALDIHRFPIRINPHGMGPTDNSQYRPASNVLLFGTGGIDDAEDAHVILHEYAHALLEASAPGLLRAREGQALHEGWSDYWAVSYTRELIESGAVPPRDWRKVFTWDGNETWSGRRLDHTGTYPEDATCTQSGLCDIWQDGRLWATTLMEIYTHTGRRTLDHLNLLSHAYLSAPATMRDAAEAIVQADVDHYGGAHLSILLEVFGRRGFIQPGGFAPHITHTPPPTTEAVTGSVVITATVISDATAVQSVYASVLTEDGVVRFELSPLGDGQYRGEIPLPGEAGMIRYFIEVEDDAGQVVHLPGAAPEETFSIVIGPDLDPPAIAHDPIDQVNLIEWPVELSVTATDRMGVDEVWVEYVIRADGAVVEDGTFRLEEDGGQFLGTFPAGEPEPNWIVDYRIHARDAAAAANEGVLPEDGWFRMEITAGSLVRAFRFEGETDAGVSATGAWERGRPEFGIRHSRSGTRLWATNLAGAYPDVNSLSTLRLPRVGLSGDEPVFLVLWHWYDTEHDGTVYPENDSLGFVWDGGNVKLSTDGGATWIVIDPIGQYPARISARYENPLGGERGFGGYSRGWRRDVFEIPAADELLIRFDFGTDAGNVSPAVDFAGWYIDQVEIRTEVDPDDEAPEFVRLPEPRITSGAAHPPLHLEVEATDDVGIESIHLFYRLFDSSAGLMAQDTVAFNMSATDPALFSAQLAPDTTLRPGYQLMYELVARDFDGNETRAPSNGGEFIVEYLHHEEWSLMDALRSTGLWRWTDNRWVTAWRQELVDRSSLVFDPVDLPLESQSISLHLTHQYQMDDGIGANVKISADDGRSWSVLEPEGGYGASYDAGAGHDMAGEPVFRGAATETHVSVFDLTAYGGRQVRLRLDYGNSRAAGQDDWWAVRDVTLSVIARDDDLPVAREFGLHAPFPNPFSTTTTIGYTLAEEGIILLEVYDAIGRRVDAIRYALRYPGSYTITYDGSRLANGVYFLSLSVGNQRDVKRLIVAR